MTASGGATSETSAREATTRAATENAAAAPVATATAPGNSVTASGYARPAYARLMRRPSGRLGGVATGLADHLDVPVLFVRLVFVVLTLVNGCGIVAYGAFWLVLPPSADRQRHRWGRPQTVLQLVVLGAVAAGGIALVNNAGLGSPTALPLIAAAAGIGVFWRQADDAQRARLRATASVRGWRPVVSALTGVVLLAVGLAGFLAARGDLAKARAGLLSTLVVVGGLVLLALPWALRATTELRAERHARIRSQERAELSAQVHDSVLQTLALIQRAADDPREVNRLARSQERELRSWLYRPALGTRTFAGGLEQAAAEVEEAHGVPVEVVVVGDAPRDEALAALTSAAREAVVNAAKHAGAPLVQVYAEVEPSQVTVFVRDRGRGFDPDDVPADRYGLAESVVGRVTRAGGEARVRSAPGEGTEVRLQVPRG